MKQRIFILLFICGWSEISLAQNPAWLWAEAQTSGSCYMQATGIWASPSGSIYMNGRFSGNLLLGTRSIFSSNTSQPFSGKLTGNGVFSWLTPHVTYTQGGNDYCYGFGGDKYGNTYSTGLINSGAGIFADAYDSMGTELWSKSFKPAGAMQGGGFAIAADNDKNVYVTGGYGGTINFGPVTLTASGYDDMFLAKLDNAGNCLWAVDAGPANALLDDGGRGVAVDQAGNVYVCGSYTGTTSFGNSITLPTTGSNNFFIAKYSSAGTALWVQTATNAGFVGPDNYWWTYNGLAIDSCANIYVTGRFKTTAQFGSLSVTSKGGADIFVAKCLASGQWEWVQSAGGLNDDAGLSLTLDKKSDVYVTGYIGGTALFGNQSVNTVAAQNVFVARFANSNGAFQWVQTPVDTGFIMGLGVTVDKQGFRYVAGSFGISPNKAAAFGSSVITGLTSCGQNIFIAKLDTTPTRNIVPAVQNVYCPGEAATLPYALAGSFNNDNVFTAQLSNDSGSFISPVNLGAVSSATGGSISITIPPNTPTGSNYLIRIVSSSPAGSSYTNCHSYITIGGTVGAPVVSDDTSICSGASVQLHASGGTAYSWSPGAAFNDSTNANPVLTPNASQIYKVIISNGNCASKTVKVAVIVTPGANITVKPADTTICSGASVMLRATGAANYLWSSALTLNDSTIANPVATPYASITYTVTGSNGACTGKFAVAVNVANTFVGGVVTAEENTICAGTTGLLTLAGSSGNVLQWQSSVANTGVGGYTNLTGAAAIDTIKYKTLPLNQSTWFRVAVGSGACSAISGSLQLVVPPSLAASFGSTVNGKTVTFTSTGEGNVTAYFWDFGDGNTSASVNPVHTYAGDTIYNVCLTIYDGSNCSYTFCRNVDVTTGIVKVNAAGSFNIYPSPFGNELNIDIKKLTGPVQTINMYDVLGRVVISEVPGNNNSTFSLNTSSLAKGMYYVQIKTAAASYIQKVVKQ